jgi:hypothetical protein
METPIETGIGRGRWGGEGGYIKEIRMVILQI